MTPSPFPIDAFLDPRLSPGLVLTLEVGLRELGLRVVAEPSASTLTFAPSEALQETQTGQLVVLFDGKLTPKMHALALERTPAALLVACRGEDGGLAEWEWRLLQAVLGNESLLSADAPAKSFHLRQTADIDQAVEATAEFVRAAGAGSYSVGVAADVMHEICANALLDAPADPDGNPRYAHRRAEAPVIAPEDAAWARVSVAGEQIYLQAADRFGRLRPDPIAAALRQIGGTAKVNTAGGGGGLGLLRMIDQSDLVCFRVAAGRRSETSCVLTLENVRRRTARPKSVLYVGAS